MRFKTNSTRYVRTATATLGLAAVVAASACSPIATVSHAAAAKPTKTTVNHGPMPKYSSPSQVRDAITHTATAPSIKAYPWASDQTGGSDPYGMTMRQCVSFAAWYLNGHGTPFGHFTKGPKGVGTFGDAATWDAAAYKAGFKVSTRPVVGSVAQWHSHEKNSFKISTSKLTYTIAAGAAGHVAVVTHVYTDGSVDLAQYNFGFNRSYSTLPKVKAPRYIYVPLSSPAVQ